ncbi:MAG: Lrp/AsnC ligand binding domain-containing protein [Candidatus Bathyarchaeia archaeon]|jgi:DNA-binding Lrp family transcriptional regulator
MPRAYVLFNVESGSEDAVLKQLRNLNNVEEAYVSYGVYDLVVRIKADTMEQLKDSVTHKIRTIKQVRSTLTLIMMEE